MRQDIKINLCLSTLRSMQYCSLIPKKNHKLFLFAFRHCRLLIYRCFICRFASVFYQDMEKQTRKILKISGIISGGLIIAAFIVIAIALNFVFTSEKLTPVVLKTANQNLNAKLDIKDVELTFFSTFPRLGLKLKDGTLVSKVIRDTMWQRTDTLLSFKKAVLVIDVMDYLQQQR